MAGRDVLVVGGGIAGLAAARALVALGDRVTVVEQAPAWAPLGAAIVLARNGMAVLDHVGAGAAVRAAGRGVAAASILDGGGAALLRVTGDASHVAVHRADLHDALRADLSADVRLGTTVEELAVGRRVGARFSDGTSLEVDLVVGADGIRSRVRALRLGDSAPRVVAAGYRAWRVVTRDVVGVDHAVEQWGRGRRVGVVPLADGRLYAFFVEDDRGATDEDGDGVAGLRRRFAAFGGPAGRLLERLPDDAELLEHPIEQLDRVAFGRGPVVLIGDAAHAMTPNLGQGAAQALEDVPALVAVLHAGSAAGAGEALAGLRGRRVEAVKRRSDLAGRVGQIADPRAVAVRDLVLRAVPAPVAARQVDAIAAHDPLAVTAPR